MASAGSACTAPAAYDTYTSGASTNSNLAEPPREGHYGRVDYTYLNNLLEPGLNPHAGILPNTSRSYIQNTYLGGSSVHMDLSILDSETHNDGRVIEEIRSSSGEGLRRNATPLHDMIMKRDAAVDMDSEVGSSRRSDERSPKKSRKNISRESDDEGASKKARGRPRVDTRDETAADIPLQRRRTQIRLAQRAYRLRKETTISSLKERVSELQSAIDGVNQSFLKFNDNAMSSGIIQARPDLARDLRETTEQFLKLARMANSDQNHDFDEEMEEIGGPNQEEAVGVKPKASPRHGKATPSGRVPQAPEKPKPDPWGYRVVYGEQPLNENGKRPSESSPSPELQHAASRRGWENIDADASRSPISSPSEGRFDPDHTLQQYRAEIPSPGRVFASQQIAPPMPWTFSPQETTFARRLHRAAIERGYHLLLSPDSPPDEITRVFQFCSTWSDRDKTLQRLREMLGKSDKECLEFWQSPLLHIGGAGLHYPRKDGLGNTRGLTDLTVPVRPIGPMALANTANAREKGLTPESYLSAFGFDGEWLDCYDVENYLREKGVVFADDSSFIKVGSPDPFEIVSAETPPTPGFSGNSSGSSNANSHPSPAEQSMSYNSSDDFSFPDVLFPDSVVDPFITSLAPENDSYFAANVEKPLRNDNAIYPPKSHGQGLDSFGFSTGMQPNVTSIPHILNNNNNNTVVPKKPGGSKGIVNIDLATLVEGRAPGFRKAEVNEAVRTAAIALW
ncbi:MAG: hypothetical protein M1840_008012 [Geoglossum simile]|nr:MAG: hypothetical protein M1840_008012 [Geoglossum simile]